MTVTKHVTVAAFALACMVGTLVFLRSYQHGEAVPVRQPLRDMPLRIDAWQGKENDLSAVVLRTLGISDYAMRTYHNAEGAPVLLYVGYYQSQRQGATIHSPKNCYPGSGWQTLESGSVMLDIPGAKGSRVRVNRFLIAKGFEKRLVLYWYQERGRVIANEYQAKFYMIVDAMTRNRTDGALIRLSSVVSESMEATEARLVAFTQRLFPLLSLYLPD